MPNAPMPTAPSAVPMPTSSSASASRDGTSSPSGVLCESVREVVKPNAPASSASMVSRRISATSSGVAGSRRIARSPLELVHELRKRLPLPGEPGGEHRVGDFLDALHQVHQGAAMLLLHRRE